jgi:hypothetical protein
MDVGRADVAQWVDQRYVLVGSGAIRGEPDDCDFDDPVAYEGREPRSFQVDDSE